MTLNKLAVDIVLLPSEEIMDAALQMNQELLLRFEKKIALDRSHALPHLSLAMGALKEEDLPAAANFLEEIASYFPPIPLIFTGIDAGPIATGETVAVWKVDPTAVLQSLHETVFNRLSPLLAHDATAEDFIDFPDVATASVDWVNRYPEAAAFERFSPHITLGIGALVPGTSFPPRGAAPRLALCRLGNYCTCRKILFETPLHR
ncbi:MAG: 2'-5' RNA ligase family protein [Candidatus Manganitrophus sp.]|nr:2'-5' RNA ligase family protein [Candidatus Manganitrophus sp.]MDC4227811.1 2'-5' RNA ligase family protein [Candidatus Manganitrophus sp.]WDT70903.1 MAG: 2'-5' RNA ligase family protein [Candidatus Manganitrophus sp.]WDT81824.1 MAG: 2'-5' RNA ligase family protein [Candidatus Manganitrophus sp.]